MNNIESRLIKACTSGDVQTAKKLIEKVDINNHYGNGNTLLTLASYHGNSDIIDLLIENGADLDAKNKDGVTALMISSNEGYVDIIKNLLKNSASINIQDNKGFTVIFHAEQQICVIDLLVKNGANLDIKDKHGNTALIFAARKGQKDIIELLIKYGANINIQNHVGDTALMKSSVRRDYDLVKIFIESGANISLVNVNNETALDSAIRIKNVISMVLLQKDLLNTQDEEGDTLAMYSCRIQNVDYVYFLYEQGADFFIKNNKGESAYDLLVNEDDLPEMLQAFKEKLALENEIDKNECVIFGL